MIAFRKRHARLRRRAFFTGERERRGLPDITWHGSQLDQPGWNDPELARARLHARRRRADEPDLHVMMNMDDATHDFELPHGDGRRWHRGASTPRCRRPTTSPSRAGAARSTGERYHVEGRSIVVLILEDSRDRAPDAGDGNA